MTALNVDDVDAHGASSGAADDLRYYLTMIGQDSLWWVCFVSLSHLLLFSFLLWFQSWLKDHKRISLIFTYSLSLCHTTFASPKWVEKNGGERPRLVQVMIKKSSTLRSPDAASDVCVEQGSGKNDSHGIKSSHQNDDDDDQEWIGSGKGRVSSQSGKGSKRKRGRSRGLHPAFGFEKTFRARVEKLEKTWVLFWTSLSFCLLLPPPPPLFPWWWSL